MKKYKHIFLLLMFCLMLLFAKSKAGERLAMVFSDKESGTDAVIVIDAGHGGVDPGKVGENGTLEKDINLSIAGKLRSRLEQNGFRVVMTRDNDEGLYSENARNKKREDMEARVRVISEADPDFVVSIHQNSFPDASCKGAQLFYYKDSEGSKKLAETLQKKLLEVLQDGNTRQAKANSDYYLLRKTACPVVIAECGFLSNAAEAALLASDAYQEKVAEALCLGILQYRSEVSGQ
ncbi:MAG: N-acetylmuramoyl-L-alanine amidase CwlD [Lachnospiraceae bacterium]|nr:N-acetylmuramoyl-L-alanine amidase CwlD [Lachnospiraceae bacterium]MBQ8548291.1 N-acetylmuramoyl-L-alanine amidase CwlD [Lachnospiraceae bacterium]MBQ8846257.1 N-acetylmuramoyl-L-alanine amidase CwlD [Lachnospiraceae bacterium]